MQAMAYVSIQLDLGVASDIFDPIDVP